MQATRINLLDFKTAPMRAFHLAWVAFFLAFFGWFGVAPLMAVIRDDLHLSKEQVSNCVIASVAITVLVRLLIGPLCDRIGPRLTYSWLLILGSLPVLGIGFAQNYETFLLFRLAIGAIGAAFVVMQYHTSVMFAPNCVGTANATAAGWGNLGGGVTQIVMPLLLAGLLSWGVSPSLGWRLAMVVPGGLLLAMGIAYRVLTQDTPEGNFPTDRAAGARPSARRRQRGSFWIAARDHRVWALFFAYGACFGVEITVDNIAALYFHDQFSLSLEQAGLIAGLFGMMNLFARALGGLASDRVAARFGLNGRVWLLFTLLLLEGIGIILFALASTLVAAIVALLTFALFVKMSNGATYGVVPFLHRSALGAVAGIVGAGGNAGAVAAGFLFRAPGLSTQQAFLLLGIAVVLLSFCALVVRFAAEAETADEAAEGQAVMDEPAAALATG